MQITSKLVITPFCVDNELEIIVISVISPKICQILELFYRLQYDNKKPDNNIVRHR